MPASDAFGQRYLRTQPCDLCAGEQFELIARWDRRGRELDTVICRRCGLISHGRIPTDVELEEYYRREYRRDYHGETTPSAHRVVRAWRSGQALLRRLTPFVAPGDRVFEVGAGIGLNVKAFELAGHDASGIEPNEGFQSYSQEMLRAKVDRARLEDLRHYEAFDLVLLNHVIEHFNAPADALRRIHRILRPGGRLYVECPNVAAPHAAPGKLFHYAHVYNFTHSSLRMLAGACGFELVEQFSREADKNLCLLLRRSGRVRLDLDWDNYRRTLVAIRRYGPIGYHCRVRYLRERIAAFAGHLSDHIRSSRRRAEIERRCQQHSLPAPSAVRQAA